MLAQNENCIFKNSIIVYLCIENNILYIIHNIIRHEDFKYVFRKKKMYYLEIIII